MQRVCNASSRTPASVATSAALAATRPTAASAAAQRAARNLTCTCASFFHSNSISISIRSNSLLHRQHTALKNHERFRNTSALQPFASNHSIVARKSQLTTASQARSRIFRSTQSALNQRSFSTTSNNEQDQVESITSKESNSAAESSADRDAPPASLESKQNDAATPAPVASVASDSTAKAEADADSDPTSATSLPESSVDSADWHESVEARTKGMSDVEKQRYAEKLEAQDRNDTARELSRQIDETAVDQDGERIMSSAAETEANKSHNSNVIDVTAASSNQNQAKDQNAQNQEARSDLSASDADSSSLGDDSKLSSWMDGDDWVDEEEMHREMFLQRELSHSPFDGRELSHNEIKDIEARLRPHEVAEFQAWREHVQPLNIEEEEAEEAKLDQMDPAEREEYERSKFEHDKNTIQQMNKWQLLVKQQRDLRMHQHIHSTERLTQLAAKYDWVNWDRFSSFVGRRDAQFFDREHRVVSRHYDVGNNHTRSPIDHQSDAVLLADAAEQAKLFALLPRSAWIAQGRVTKMTGKGRRVQNWVMVIAGDMNGTAGWGIGKAIEPAVAEYRAKIDLKHNLTFTPLVESRTIMHAAEGRFGVCKAQMWPQPRDRGMVAGYIPRILFECIGIRDISCKLIGRRPARHQVMAVFDALMGQMSHRQIAIAKGVNLYRKFDRSHMYARTPNRAELRYRFAQVAATLEKIRHEKLLLASADERRAKLHPSLQITPRRPLVDSERHNQSQIEELLVYDPELDQEHTKAEKLALLKLSIYYKERVALETTHAPQQVHGKPMRLDPALPQVERGTIMPRPMHREKTWGFKPKIEKGSKRKAKSRKKA